MPDAAASARRGGAVDQGLQTNDFEAALPVDEQMDANERIRLLYVATTRARDHLVVSLHRTTSGARTNAVELAETGAADGVESFVGDRPPPDGRLRGRRSIRRRTGRRGSVAHRGAVDEPAAVDGQRVRVGGHRARSRVARQFRAGEPG